MAIADCGVSFIAGLRLCGFADAHAPDGRSLFQIFPRKFAGVFKGELIIERLGVVIVDQQKTFTWLERSKGLEDERMALCGRHLADINDLHYAVSMAGLVHFTLLSF